MHQTSLAAKIGLLCITGACLLPCEAGAIGIPVQNDAQVNQANPTFNYGAGPNLNVSNNAIRYGYVRFAPESFLPAGTTASQISQAILYLYVSNVATAGAVNVYSVTSSWTEGTGSNTAVAGLNWNNRPTESATVLATINLSSADEGEFIALDVTSLVKDWITTPSQNFGLVFKPNGTVTVVMDTKDNTTTSHPPMLDVTLAGPAGTPGTKWITGTTAPSASIGVDGDFYLNTVTSQYYTKVSGAWNTPASLKGANGSKWVSGTGVPAAGVGADGDFYLDTASSVYYGPKAAGVWPGAGTSIKGQQGIQGPATIRILPGGDLSMGQFTSGTLP